MNNNILSEFVDLCFEVRNIKLFETDKKEFADGRFKNYYLSRNVSESKPEYNFGLLFVTFIFLAGFFIAALSNKNFVVVFIISILFIVEIIILFLNFKTKTKNWIKIDFKYQELLEKKKEYLDKNLIPKIESFIKTNTKYYPISVIVYNEIVENKQDSKEKSLLRILNNKVDSESECLNYTLCKYCYTYQIYGNTNCKNCGAPLEN